MKPHGDAVLTPENAYFNCRLNRARMITEGTFGKLKGRFRVRFANLKVKKETVKIIGLACAVLHNLCIDKEHTIPRKFDLSCDYVTNKRRDRAELRDMLNLTSSRLKNYETRRGEGVKVREAIKKAFWDKKKEKEFVMPLLSEGISGRALLGNFFTISNVPQRKEF